MSSKGSDPVAGAEQDSGSTEPSDGPSGSTSGTVLIDIEFVRALIEAVDESGIDSLEISRGGTRVRISKSPPPVPAMPGAMTVPAAAVPATPPGPPPAEAEEPSPRHAPSGPTLAEVKSPMVGTFYRAPAPEAPPYVEVGSTVSRGQTLCILEAMKLMNELECEVDGVVREILVENADPVEFGQILFRIEPAGSGA